MNSFDTAYLDILGDVMDNGVRKEDRTGTGTISRFGTQARFNLRDNRLPLLSIRKVFHRSFIHETLWFLSGSTDIQYLKENNVSIWDSWVKPETARYQDLTLDEMLEKLRPVLLEYYQRTEGDLHSQPITSVDFQYPEQWQDEVTIHYVDDPTVDEGIKVVLVFSCASVIRKLYLEYLGEEPRKLIGGSIGKGAYGSQWRAWEDTRVVQTNEVPQYQDKGYRRLGDLTHGGCSVVYREIDQIANVVKQLKENPDSRRIMVIAFNPAKVEECELPPCHSIFQFWTRELSMEERIVLVSNDSLRDEIQTELAQVESTGSVSDRLDSENIPKRALSCMLYMRSSDYPVGAVFNIPQYALLTHMLAQVTGMVAEELIFTGADTHIYQNQYDGVLDLLQREGHDTEARVVLNPEVMDIDQFVFDDIEVISYEHDGVIRFPVAV